MVRTNATDFHGFPNRTDFLLGADRLDLTCLLSIRSIDKVSVSGQRA